MFLNHLVPAEIAATGVMIQIHMYAYALADLDVFHLRAATHADGFAAVLERHVIIAAAVDVRVRP